MATMRTLIRIVEGRQSAAQRLVAEAEFLDRRPVRLSLGVQADNEVNIERLSVWPPTSRGQGYATETMTELCNLADRLQVTLYLEALPEWDEDEMDVERLVGFYRKFGFEGGENPDVARMMWRPPKPRKRRRAPR